MGRYARILVAFDGSESGRNALRQAIRLAKTEEACLGVLSVLPSYEGNIEFIGVRDIEAVLRGPIEKRKAEVNGIASAEDASVEIFIEQGKAYERIVEKAATGAYDLVVMGRRGMHRSARMLVGSVTSRVIGHTEKDVLVIPREASMEWKNIVLAVDDSECSRAAVDGAMYLAGTYKGVVTAVSGVDLADEFYAEVPEAADQMMDKAESALQEVRATAEKKGVSAEFVVRVGKAHEAVLEVAEEKDGDVIVMGSHGRTGLTKLIMGSVTEKVIGYARCPVMVVKHRNQ